MIYWFTLASALAATAADFLSKIFGSFLGELDGAGVGVGESAAAVSDPSVDDDVNLSGDMSPPSIIN